MSFKKNNEITLAAKHQNLVDFLVKKKNVQMN